MSLLFMQRCERRSYNPVPCDDSNDKYDVVAVVVVVFEFVFHNKYQNENKKDIAGQVAKI